ncbi:MAG: hypothetical protein JJU11_18725 [Candidatus Sumerlaeia bacterium]|nr:hypothetical protein [Candidatus Sumerlaeia bacterium]
MENIHRIDRDFTQAREHYIEHKARLFEILPLRLELIDDEELLVAEAATTWSNFVDAIRDLLEFSTRESFDSEARLEKTELARTVESQLQSFESENLPDGVRSVEDLNVFSSETFESFKEITNQTVPQLVTIASRETLLKWQSRTNVIRVSSLTFGFLAMLMFFYFILNYIVRRKNSLFADKI